MKRKIKKLPKYWGGTQAVLAANNPAPNIYDTEVSKRLDKTSDQVDLQLQMDNPAQNELTWAQKNMTNITNGLGLATNLAANSIGKSVTAGSVLGGMGQGAAFGASVGGPWGAVIGGVAGGALSAIGTGGSVDELTGEITNPSGIAGLFGHSKSYLQRKSNRIKNTNLGKQLTQQLRADYYNDPNVEYNPNTFAEGGIMRRPVEALVSKGELIYDPTTLKLSKVPGSKGKPNKKDDVYAKLYEGDVVISNSPTMVMSNGKTPAQNLEGLVDSDKNKKAKEAIIKKVVNWLEANRTKPQEYAMYYEGTPKVKSDKQQLAEEIFLRKLEQGLLENSFIYRQKDGKFVIQDINGNRYDIPEMLLPYILGDDSGYYFGPQTGVAPSAGKWNGTTNFAKQILNSKNVAKLKNTATRVLGNNAKSVKPAAVKPVSPNAKPVDTNVKDLGEVTESARMAYGLNRAMMSQAWLRGRTSPNNLAGTTTGRDVGSQALWNLPKPASAVDDVLVGEGFRSNLPYYLGLMGMIGAAGTFLTHEATKGEPLPVDVVANVPVNNVSPVITPSPSDVINDNSVSSAAKKKMETSSNTVDKKKDIKKPVSKNTPPPVATPTAPSPEDTVIRRPTDSTPAKQSPSNASRITTPHIKKDVVYGRDGSVRYDYNIPETRVTTKTSDTGDTAKKSWGSNWQDNLYKLATLTQPLWDRAKAEPVDYTVPTYKYMPTGIDVSGQLRDVDQSYALSRYNFANISPNTGAGMAYSLQAAANRAKQLADIRQYQTNAQNELIGKNVGIYNNWANEYANIMNSVYDKNAANRAAARNINRKNRSAALMNYGQMLRDDKANKMEKMKFAALAPSIKSTYEDGSAMDIRNLYHELFG